GRAWRGLGATLRTQAIATVGLAPPTLVFFQQVSLIGLVANLMAIPLVTLVVLPLALLGVAVPPLWSLAAMVVTPLHAVLSALASVPGGVWSAALAPVWAQWAAGVGATLAVLPLPWRLRTVALVLCVPMLLPVPDTPPPGGFDLIAPDVGQGTAALVRTRAHLLIFDTGPPYGPHGDAGERVLLPLLQRRGETRIDRLVLSHRDADHVGGAATVMGALPVAVLSSSLEPGHALLRLAPVHSRCEAGESWEWDGVRFDMLHPPAAAYERRSKPNARSCVLRVSAPGRSVLLTADIERPQETALLADPGALRSDWLFAPHHGSKTSSSAAFLDAVRPRVAVVQAGYRNRYRHPAADVLARYRSRGIAVVESAACGAFTLRWSDPGTGSCQRDVARRYWHHDAVRGRSVRPAEQE
ncbi:MAG: DNA internalization-related competence protein ComEC/Rec2, partial [Pseudomonadota bacterium]|nr:DNA internalization-related competence protein ComEC/Rec2 [Pseudomonadota bacterium]